MLSRNDFEVTHLGARTHESPLGLSDKTGDGVANYVSDDARVLHRITAGAGEEFDCGVFMERAGPREALYFNPADTRAAIVTCGGLCPGLNNVIRSLFLELHYKYKVPEVIGFQYGFRGINPANGLSPIAMTRGFVKTIHNAGGSALGTSRGAEEVSVIVDRLQEDHIDILFCVGGDGTLRGAHEIAGEASRRGADIAIVGIPKTIDNDIPFIYKTFGFDTAVGVVRSAIDSAHVEAVGMINGIGLVKVMGRNAGFIAAYGTLASMEVNFCLVPEVPFGMHGDGALLDLLEERLRASGHAVIVVAEGAGQEFFGDTPRTQDASGNIKFHDIGTYIKQEVEAHFAKSGMPISMKYIDPSYMIRSVRANASDAIFCDTLARNAVHAAMAGKTDVVIGIWHGVHVHLPISLVTGPRKRIQPESFLWRNVLGATGQPRRMTAK